MIWPIALLAASITFGGPISQTPPDSANAVKSATVQSISNNVVVWPTSDTPSRRSKAKGVPNFGKLNAAVWRSGQPSKEGMEELAKMGVKTIVNLQLENPQEKDIVPAGVHYFYIPVKDENAPTEEQGKQFLSVVSNPNNWPVLVHCHGGEGRAGVMAALVRHAFDGWTEKQIMQEVGNFRNTYFGFVKTGLCGCQKAFLAKWVTNNQPGAYRQALLQNNAPQQAQLPSSDSQPALAQK
jgi:protein tyrosine phosphatase (PTP) superfamily phosphohydrolase (DUF442 family)